MISVQDKNIAIIGGGRFCHNFLQIMTRDDLLDSKPRVLGVADKNKEAEGIVYARENGIFTTHDFRELFKIKDLQIILELTRDNLFSEILKKEMPPEVRLIDHFEAAFIWNSLRMEQERLKTLKELSKYKGNPEKTLELFNQYSDRLVEIINKRTEYSLKIERDLVEKESAMSQIIQGSVIPTFVINKDHEVIHWNRALEKFSGFSSEEMIGTKRQSMPFWRKERPTMADAILDQSSEADIEKLYAGASHKSQLIKGAFEAEAFFPSLGKNGKWCWFTAAPIQAPDGTIIGAIETLWDTTEKKKAEEEREKHTKELSALCTLYGALNSPYDLDERIKDAVQEVRSFLAADGICIYLLKGDGRFHLRYSEGLSEAACLKSSIADETSTIYRVAQSNEYKILEDLPHGCEDEICFLEETKLVSLAYIPISSNDRGMTGVIRIGSRKPGHFTHKHKDILELMGNRIGVAIENMRLQQQSVKSEEKYRTLFDNNPHPTFILDQQDLLILDTNERAQECYGYSREELLGIPFMQLGDENDEELREGLTHLAEGPSSRFIKKRHYRKGTQPFFVNANFSLAKYGRSNVVIASTTDITESVEKEAQLIQAGKMTTLGVMAAGMAHEINQPLNVIQVCADYFQKMLKRGQPIRDDDLSSMANDIISNVERATAVITHVRDFARQSDVVKDKVNINEPIKDVFKVLGHQIKVHKIELELDLDPDLPLIMAEYNRLEQVFINLVTNSIDAMDEMDQSPETKNEEKRLKIKSFTDHDQVVITVSDTGMGMTEEVKKKIFEPFFTTKKIGRGTGLGISISYGIIKDYDGTIAVESEVGKGTTFYLRFPALKQTTARQA